MGDPIPLALLTLPTSQREYGTPLDCDDWCCAARGLCLAPLHGERLCRHSAEGTSSKCCGSGNGRSAHGRLERSCACDPCSGACERGQHLIPALSAVGAGFAIGLAAI